jgi:periplasmic protein TonB
VVIAPVAPAATPAPPAPPRVAARPAIGNVGACAPGPEDYPAVAQKEEATGTTRVRFTVDAAGKLASAEVVKSAGASRAHKALDRVAVSKLSECTFKPGLDENGRAVGGTFDVEYVWKLAG